MIYWWDFFFLLVWARFFFPLRRNAFCTCNYANRSMAVLFPSIIHSDRYVLSEWNGFIKAKNVARFNSVNSKRLIENIKKWTSNFLSYVILRQIWKKKMIWLCVLKPKKNKLIYWQYVLEIRITVNPVWQISTKTL